MKRTMQLAAAAVAALLLLSGCGTSGLSAASVTGTSVPESWTGDDKDGVCAYLESYNHLPGNYMTKKEARKYGFEVTVSDKATINSMIEKAIEMV